MTAECPHFSQLPRVSLLGANTVIAIFDPKDMAEAVAYLTEARHVAEEVLHLEDGAHAGRW
jgi:hypothetical protein